MEYESPTIDYGRERAPSLPGPSNPIAFAQFHLNGGWKTNGIVAVIFGMLLTGLIYLSSQRHGVISPPAVRSWGTGMLVIEALVLLIFGAFRVEASVRSDVTSRMIDSHRLMPSSTFTSILGYVLVAPVTAFAIAVSTVIVGIGCCLYSGLDPAGYLVSSVLAVIFSVFLWAMVARFAFDSRGGFLLLLLAAGLLYVSEGSLVTLLPAVSVLTCPLIGNPVFEPVSVDQMAGPEYFAAGVGQLAIATVCILAAARRFRSDDSIGFSVPLGLSLVAIWVVLSRMGMDDRLHFIHARMFRRSSIAGPSERFVASFAGMMLLATLPLAAAAKMGGRWSLHGRSPAIPRRPLSIVVVGAIILLAGSMLLLIPWAQPVLFRAMPAFAHSAGRGSVTPISDPISFDYPADAVLWRFGVTFGSFALFLISTGCLFRWIYLGGRRPVVITIVWLFVTWILPPVLAGIGGAIWSERDFTPVIGISPVGLPAMAWLQDDLSAIPGLIGQALIAGFAATLLALRFASLNNAPVTGSDIRPAV